MKYHLGSQWVRLTLVWSEGQAEVEILTQTAAAQYTQLLWATNGLSQSTDGSLEQDINTSFKVCIFKKALIIALRCQDGNLEVCFICKSQILYFEGYMHHY